MRDYMIVVYEGAKAIMQRSSGGPWHADAVEEGVISLLTRAEQSVWRWDRPIRVKHIYVSHEIIEQTAHQVFEKDIDRVRIDDRVRRKTRSSLFTQKCWRVSSTARGSAKGCI